MLTAVAVAMAGCSGGGSSRVAAAVLPSRTSTSPSSVAPTTPPAPTATTPTAPSMPSTSASGPQSTGGYLKTLLPLRATEAMLGLGPTLPSGWVGDDIHEQDSGSAATTAAPSLVSADNCDYLTAKSFDLAGGLSVASASEPLEFGNTGARLAFYAYGPGDAAKSLAQVRQNIASACDVFNATMNLGVTVVVNVSATPVSGLGDEALLVKITPQGAYVEQEDLLVRRGNLMMSLWADDTYGSFPDLSPVAATLVSEMG